ncbi:PepSY domain-containing protein [Citrobacter meridianamericanus]|uniref:PepSY domain-containing protein n=1 Tax=Citrobacter meridianamericanus TaxID=2894201 RepID=A0ABT1BFF4_9ENTR|nr:PepSY domain-containing protein [Citrobacter meridianamericanus]MCO5784606.1 PepSY domain-containing protein [Citrobacter meridianamericanus]
MGKVLQYGGRISCRLCGLAVLLWLGSFSVSVSAAPALCQPHPQAEWMALADLRQMLEEYGYVIQTLSVKGDCYEMQGKNQEGEPVRLLMDTQSADVVLSEQDEEPDL